MKLTGARAVQKALDAPLGRIAINAGHEGQVVVAAVRSLGKGQGFKAAPGSSAISPRRGSSTG